VSLPEGLQARVVHDSTTFVTDTIRAVIRAILEAFVLVAIVVFLFLGNLRATHNDAQQFTRILRRSFAMHKQHGQTFGVVPRKKIHSGESLEL
jgi:hypothetical protein